MCGAIVTVFSGLVLMKIDTDQESALCSTICTKNKSIFNINIKGEIPSPKDFLKLEVLRIQIQIGSDILTKVMYNEVQEPTHHIPHVPPRNMHPSNTFLRCCMSITMIAI